MWLPLKNKVYNIEENLATLFLWPGGTYSTCGYDYMDSFTVSSNGVVMSTQGFLVMSFDFVSACIHGNIFDISADNEEEDDDF